MLQTYRGQFQNGQFIPLEEVVIPDNVEVYVIITDNTLPTDTPRAQKQLEAFEEFAKVISKAAPLGEDFDEILREGINIPKELAQ